MDGIGNDVHKPEVGSPARCSDAVLVVGQLKTQGRILGVQLLHRAGMDVVAVALGDQGEQQLVALADETVVDRRGVAVVLSVRPGFDISPQKRGCKDGKDDGEQADKEPSSVSACPIGVNLFHVISN